MLNYIGCNKRKHGYVFVDDNKIKLLKEIVDQTGAKIVLSSTWRINRFSDDKEENPKEYGLYYSLVNKLKEYDLTIYAHTPVLLNRHRGTEINQWLNQWRGEPIENFIILDDDIDMRPYMDKLIKTSITTGLTQEDVKVAIAMLNKS